MTQAELIEFLNKTRDECSYEMLGSIPKRTLSDGTEVIGPHTDGKFTYEDRYKGSDWFKGREEVKVEDKVVWYRGYEGGITTDTGRKQMKVLYDFLKAALRACPEDLPFRRGPKCFVQDNFEYEDTCEGDITNFKGREKILFLGEEIYYLNYEGASPS